MAIDIPDEPERVDPGQDKEDLIAKSGFPTVEKDKAMLTKYSDEDEKKKKKGEQKDAPATPQPSSLQSKQLREHNQNLNLRVNRVSSP